MPLAVMVPMITSVSRVVAAFKRRWRKVRNRPDHGSPRLRFWLKLAWQTLTRRDMLVLSLEMEDSFRIKGLENLPEEGVFTLALNHTMRRWTPRLLAAVHQATLARRPDLAREWLVIVGYKEARLEGRPAYVRRVVKELRRLYTWIYMRWIYNTLRLPMDNDRASIQALREWRRRAHRQPSVVFPEGRGAATFEEIRSGAGRMLAALDVPVLPVSVWWDSQVCQWQIVFGPVIEWAADSRLHDLQIGLEIAAGLPVEEAPNWQEALEEWESAHESVESELVRS